MFRSARFALVFFSAVLLLGTISGCPTIQPPDDPLAPRCVPALCDDNNPCTTEECVDTDGDGNDECVNTPVECPERLFCNPDTGECVPCVEDAHCDDGEFCSGAETCDADGRCQPGTDPCPGQLCRESDDTCVICLDDSDCDDGTFCNGAETCDASGDCQLGPGDPCVGTARPYCNEVADRCVECLTEADCDDDEQCVNGECVPKPPEPCTTDFDCDHGEICDRDSGDCILASVGGTRGLPTCYDPDASFTVRIVLNPTDETLVVGLQEFLPSGWTVSEISHEGKWDATNGAVKWFFLDSSTQTLSYTVAVPADAAGSACFVGQVNSDGGVDQDTGGNACVEECTGD